MLETYKTPIDMKIKKKGKMFVAYRDEHDTGKDFSDGIKVGDSLGQISITTGRFCGNTVCLVLLSNHLDEYLKPQQEKYEELIDEVIDNIKKDVEAGDLTVLDELLRMIPTRNLIQSLGEERWNNYKGI